MSDEPNPLYEGLEFPDFAVTVTEELQGEKLRCCGIDADVFGSQVDITAFAGETIMATKHAGISINGSVHVGQYFDLREPIALGEALILSGRVTKVEPEPRGHLVTAAFEARRADGSIPLLLERTSLRIAATSPRKGPLGRSSEADPDPEAMVLASVKQLEPEHVARYSIEAENLIHSDPAVARQFGFKAPIAGGLMAVRMMMEALVKHGALRRLQMSVRFRRPMFWDERLEVRRRGSEHAPEAFAVFRSDAKVLTQSQIHAIERM